jgi:transposase
VASATLRAELPELGRLDRRKIAALVGDAPFNRDSGTLRGKRMIQGGRSCVRATLYTCTLLAISRNPIISAYCRRLHAAGEPSKVALVACIRKLTVILNSMIRSETSWSPPGIAAG